MALKIEVHQGNQIGGCITVISTDTTKIVIDYGENLPGSTAKSNIEFDWENEKVDAVFFTHYHGDHIGRFMEIPDGVCMYMGEVTYKVMLNIRRAISGFKDSSAAEESARAVDKLVAGLENEQIRFVEQDKPITVGDITVTGFGVDHSAYDAYMYLIEANGTNILHTGDYRDHGHRGHIIKNGVDHNIVLDVINYRICRRKVVDDEGNIKYYDRPVDILITEGTMMGERAGDERFSEKQLQAWAKDYFREHRYIFLKVSSTNVDTLASFYHAARANKMTMYANSYVRRQFKVYRGAGQKHGTTMYDFYGTKNLCFLSDDENADNTKAYEQIQEMRNNGFVAIVGEYEHYERLMAEFADLDPVLIYSMWDGYLNPDRDAYNEQLDAFCKRYNMIKKHTSGHAYPKLIKQVIKAVNPRLLIWPIHTENAAGFEKLDISDELRAKIKTDQNAVVIE